MARKSQITYSRLRRKLSTVVEDEPWTNKRRCITPSHDGVDESAVSDPSVPSEALSSSSSVVAEDEPTTCSGAVPPSSSPVPEGDSEILYGVYDMPSSTPPSPPPASSSPESFRCEKCIAAALRSSSVVTEGDPAILFGVNDAPLPTPPSSFPRFSPPPSSPPKPFLCGVLRPFASLKRKLTAKDKTKSREQQKSQDCSSNKEKSTTNPPPPAKAKKQQRLTQLILDLGGRTQKKCKECGMEYVPSNSEDVAAHKKFHRTSIEGVDLGKLFLSRLGEKNKMWTGDDGALIAVVTRQDPLYMRIKAKAVLDVVNEELGAAPMTDEEVWDQVVTGNADDSPYTREHRNKIYLYIDGSKCVGALLGQRLVEAHRIITEEPPRDEQPSDMPWARPPVARIPADTESQAPVSMHSQISSASASVSDYATARSQATSSVSEASFATRTNLSSSASASISDYASAKSRMTQSSRPESVYPPWAKHPNQSQDGLKGLQKSLQPKTPEAPLSGSPIVSEGSFTTIPTLPSPIRRKPVPTTQTKLRPTTSSRPSSSDSLPSIPESSSTEQTIRPAPRASSIPSSDSFDHLYSATPSASSIPSSDSFDHLYSATTASASTIPSSGSQPSSAPTSVPSSCQPTLPSSGNSTNLTIPSLATNPPDLHQTSAVQSTGNSINFPIPSTNPRNFPGDDSQPHPLCINPSPEPTFLGISRVWTAKNHRRRNIAHTLCHTATKTFFLGQPLPKDSVAFSQPTNLGRKLAAKFFCTPTFKVYSDWELESVSSDGTFVQPLPWNYNPYRYRNPIRRAWENSSLRNWMDENDNSFSDLSDYSDGIGVGYWNDRTDCAEPRPIFGWPKNFYSTPYYGDDWLF